MPYNKSNTEKLYNALINDDYDPAELGKNAEEFSRNLQDTTYATKVHKALMDDDYDPDELGKDANAFIDNFAMPKDGSTRSDGGQVQQVQQPQQVQPGYPMQQPYPAEMQTEIDRRYNDPSNVAGNFKDKAQIAREIQEEKRGGIIGNIMNTMRGMGTVQQSAEPYERNYDTDTADGMTSTLDRNPGNENILSEEEEKQMVQNVAQTGQMSPTQNNRMAAHVATQSPLQPEETQGTAEERFATPADSYSKEAIFKMRTDEQTRKAAAEKPFYTTNDYVQWLEKHPNGTKEGFEAELKLNPDYARRQDVEQSNIENFVKNTTISDQISNLIKSNVDEAWKMRGVTGLSPAALRNKIAKQVNDTPVTTALMSKIYDEAQRLDIPFAEYLEKAKGAIVADAQQKAMTYLQERMMPNDDIQYILEGVGNSTMARIVRAQMFDPEFNMMQDAAGQIYGENKQQQWNKDIDANISNETLRKVLKTTNPTELGRIAFEFAPEFIPMGGINAMTGAALKKYTQAKISRLVALGMTPSNAARTVGLMAEGATAGEKMLQTAAVGAVNFGGYNTVAELARQYEVDEFDAKKIAKEGLKGILLGGTIGSIGKGISTATQSASGAARLAGMVGAFAAEDAVFTGMEEAEKWAEGKTGDINLVEDFVRGALTLGVMKLSSPGGIKEGVQKVRRALNGEAEPGGMLNDVEREQFMNNANCKDLTDAMNKAMTTSVSDTGQISKGTDVGTYEGGRNGIVGATADKLRTDIEEAYRSVMLDPTIDYSLKCKVAGAFKGSMPANVPRPTSFTAEDETMTVKTRDENGFVIKTTKAKNAEEYEAAKEKAMRGVVFGDALREGNPLGLEVVKQMTEDGKLKAGDVARAIKADLEGNASEEQKAIANEFGQRYMEIVKAMRTSEAGEPAGYIEGEGPRSDAGGEFELLPQSASDVTRSASDAPQSASDAADNALGGGQSASEVHRAEVVAGGEVPSGETMTPAEKMQADVRARAAGNRQRGQSIVSNDDSKGAADLQEEYNVADARLERVFVEGSKNKAIADDVRKMADEGRIEQAYTYLHDRRGEMTDGQRSALEQYIDARAAVGAMDESIVHGVSTQVQQMDATMSGLTGEDGMLTSVMVKPMGVGEPVKAYVKSGSLTNQYSSTVQVTYVTEDEYGNVIPGQTVQIAKGRIVDGSASTPVAVEDYMGAYRQQAEQQALAGWVTKRSGLQYKKGDTVRVRVGNTDADVVIVGSDANGNVVIADAKNPQNQMQWVAWTPQQLNVAIITARQNKINQTLTAEDSQRMAEVRRKKQAERDEKFRTDIVGYDQGMVRVQNGGTVDLTHKNTKVKAAAEYLVEMEGGNEAAVQWIETQKMMLAARQQQLLEQRDEEAQWIGAYGGQDNPEEQRHQDALTTIDKSLMEVTRQYQKLNQIKKESMTLAQKQALDKERSAEILTAQKAAAQKAGKPATKLNKEGLPVDLEGEIRLGLMEQKAAEEYLTKNHRTFMDANEYLKSQFERIDSDGRRVRTNLNTQRSKLQSYREGLEDYDANELREITESEHRLQQQVNDLLKERTAINALDKKLEKLYAEQLEQEWNENPEQGRMERIERRKSPQAKLDQARKEYKDYPDAIAILDQGLEPQTLEEYVSGIGAGTISWEGYGVGEHHVRGLQEEIGRNMTRSRFGKRGDTYAFDYLLSKKAEDGVGIDELAHKMSEDTQWTPSEVKEAILNMLMGASKPEDIKNYIINNRLEAAEDAARYQDEAELAAAEEAQWRAQNEGDGTEPTVNEPFVDPLLAENYEPFDFALGQNEEVAEHNAGVEKHGGLYANLGAGLLDDATANLIGGIGRKLGKVYRVKFAREIWAELPDREKARFGNDWRNLTKIGLGYTNHTTGEVTFVGEAIIKSPNMAARWLAGHETTHVIRRMSKQQPELWQAYQNAVRKAMGEEAWKNEIELLGGRYTNPNDNIVEEVCANFAGDNLFGDKQKVQQFVNGMREEGVDTSDFESAFVKFWTWMNEFAKRLKAAKSISSDMAGTYAEEAENALEIWKAMFENSAEEKVKKEANLPSDAKIDFALSTDLDEQHPDWRNQQTATGKHNTQISGTTSTYKKIGEYLKAAGDGDKSILDASSGMGLGTKALKEMGFNVEDVEPYRAKDAERPTYESYAEIGKQYDVVISNAVLNVIPDDWREGVIRDMANATKPGGRMFVNVRSAEEIRNIKNKIELDDDTEVLVEKGKNAEGQQTYAYQKGWTKEGFRQYMQEQLGDGWTVEIGNKKNSGTTSGTMVVATKVAESPKSEDVATKVGESPRSDSGMEVHTEEDGVQWALEGGSYFSGGGLVEDALKGVVDSKFGVEFDRDVAAVFRNNHGSHIINADVRSPFVKEKIREQMKGKKVEYFHASPVCKNFSVANVHGKETEIDKDTAQATAEFINEFQPEVVTIENVKGYAKSDAVQIIMDALHKNGYATDGNVYDAADFGGYIHRERIIIRAAKDGNLPMVQTQGKHRGWYEAVKDLMPRLSKVQLAPWQKRRLEQAGIDWRDVKEPLIVYGGSAGSKIQAAWGSEPAPSINTHAYGTRIIMPDGDVLMATPRVFARLMGVPDSYKLPSSLKTAYEVIGNGVPEQLTKGVIVPLVEAHDKRAADAARTGAEIGKSVAVDEQLKAARKAWQERKKKEAKQTEIQWALDVFHGSSAEFDEFDKRFMGSGQGAHVLGAGIYVTSDEPVAKYYAQIASDNNSKITQERAILVNGEPAKTQGAFRALQLIEEHKNIDNAIEYTKAKIERFAERKQMGIFKGNADYLKEALKYLEMEKENPGTIKYQEEKREVPDRQLYEVQIPDDTGSNYLDLDKEITKEVFNTAKSKTWDMLMSRPDEKDYWQKQTKLFDDIFADAKRGDSLYWTLENTLGSEDATNVLADMGYIGNKSHDAKEGDMAYCIYDPKDITMKKRTNLDTGEEIQWALDVDKAGDVNELVSVIDKKIGGKINPLLEQWKKELKGEDRMPFGEQPEEIIELVVFDKLGMDKPLVMNGRMFGEDPQYALIEILKKATEAVGLDSKYRDRIWIEPFPLYDNPSDEMLDKREEIENLWKNALRGGHRIFTPDEVDDIRTKLPNDYDRILLDRALAGINLIYKVNIAVEKIKQLDGGKAVTKLLFNLSDIRDQERMLPKGERMKHKDMVRKASETIGKYLTNELNEVATESNEILWALDVEKHDPWLSNAAEGVRKIKQEKATGEQWVKMLQKNGGLKAEEDKWIGLSEWLGGNTTKNKTVTKAEVMRFIQDNAVRIEEVHYSEDGSYGAPMYDMNDDDIKQEVYESAAWSMLNDDLIEYDNDDNPYISKKAFNDYYYRLKEEDAEKAENFWNGFHIDYWGEGLEISDIYDAAMFCDLDIAKIPEGSEKPINETRKEYRTEGLTNNHEIALTVPTVEGYRGALPEVHFADEHTNGKTVAWVRFGDADYVNENYIDAQKEKGRIKTDYWRYMDELRKKYGLHEYDFQFRNISEEDRAELTRRKDAFVEASNKADKTNFATKVLVMDEVQSQRHQDGREKGYTNDMEPAVVKAKTVADEAYEKWQNLVKDYSTSVSRLEPVEVLRGKQKDIEAAQAEYRKLYDEYLSVWRSGVPDAPFRKNWAEIGMKRMLRYAVENGYDKLAWTTGAQQAERYNIGGTVPYINVKTDLHPAADERAMWKTMRFGANGNACRVDINKQGKVILSEGLGDGVVGKPITDVFGKEVGQMIMDSKPEDRIQLEGQHIGGAGMKGFYDGMLVKFMDKYCKKWGVRTEDVELDLPRSADRVMHSVRITPEMKEEILDGQLMWALAGEIGAKNLDEAAKKKMQGESQSKTADNLRNLRMANEMKKRKYPDEDIKYSTGWERGVDGKWRLELPDLQLRMQPDGDKYTIMDLNDGETLKMKDLVVNDNGLFDAYPELADVEVSGLAEGVTLGSYNPETNTMRLNTQGITNAIKTYDERQWTSSGKEGFTLEDLAELEGMSVEQYKQVSQQRLKDALRKMQAEEKGLMDTIAHEVQHYIQHVEGFAEGGNEYMDAPESVKEERRQERQAQLDKLNKDYDEKANECDEAEFAYREAYKAYNDYVFVQDEKGKWSYSAEKSNDEEGVRLGQEVQRLKKIFDDLYDVEREAYKKIQEIEDEINAPLGKDGYWRLAGEVEARAVGERAALRLTEEERRSTLARNQIHIKPDRQIVIQSMKPSAAESARYMEVADGPRSDEQEAELRAMVRDAAAVAMPRTEVVDEYGKPMVVYHGTTLGTDEKPFTVFKTDTAWNGDNIGSHFGDRGTAGEFATNQMYEVFLNITKAYETFDFFADLFNNAYLEAAHDLMKEIGTKQAKWMYEDRVERIYPDVPKDLFRQAEERGWIDVFDNDYGLESDNRQDETFKEHREQLVELIRSLLELGGYDGLKYKNWYEGSGKEYCWVTMYPEQIKSAEAVTRDDEGNVIPLEDRFDPKEEDIRWMLGEIRMRGDVTDESNKDAWEKAKYEYPDHVIAMQDGVGYVTFRDDARKIGAEIGKEPEDGMLRLNQGEWLKAKAKMGDKLDEAQWSGFEEWRGVDDSAWADGTLKKTNIKEFVKNYPELKRLRKKVDAAISYGVDMPSNERKAALVEACEDYRQTLQEIMDGERTESFKVLKGAQAYLLEQLSEIGDIEDGKKMGFDVDMEPKTKRDSRAADNRTMTPAEKRKAYNGRTTRVGFGDGKFRVNSWKTYGEVEDKVAELADNLDGASEYSKQRVQRMADALAKRREQIARRIVGTRESITAQRLGIGRAVKINGAGGTTSTYWTGYNGNPEVKADLDRQTEVFIQNRRKERVDEANWKIGTLTGIRRHGAKRPDFATVGAQKPEAAKRIAKKKTAEPKGKTQKEWQETSPTDYELWEGSDMGQADAMGEYYDGDWQALCHAVKRGESGAIKEAARRMATQFMYYPNEDERKLEPVQMEQQRDEMILVPVPSHTGKATYTLKLVKELSKLTGIPYADILEAEPHEGSYASKAKGKSVDVKVKVKDGAKVPEGKGYEGRRMPVLIDNVVATGNTMEACRDAMTEETRKAAGLDENNTMELSLAKDRSDKMSVGKQTVSLNADEATVVRMQRWNLPKHPYYYYDQWKQEQNDDSGGWTEYETDNYDLGIRVEGEGGVLFDVPGGDVPFELWADDLKEQMEKPWKDVKKATVHTSNIRGRYVQMHYAAKHGDVKAAYELVKNVAKSSIVARIAIEHPEAVVAYPHYENEAGANAIPAAYAQMFEMYGLTVDADIVQKNRVHRTDATKYDRLMTRARFDGHVEAGQEYILVDDHITSGATLRDMKDYIESRGGTVVAWSALEGSAGSTNVELTEENYNKLKELGVTDEQVKQLGISRSIKNLTNSEARELAVLAKRGRDFRSKAQQAEHDRAVKAAGAGRQRRAADERAAEAESRRLRERAEAKKRFEDLRRERERFVKLFGEPDVEASGTVAAEPLRSGGRYLNVSGIKPEQRMAEIGKRGENTSGPRVKHKDIGLTDEARKEIERIQKEMADVVNDEAARVIEEDKKRDIEERYGRYPGDPISLRDRGIWLTPKQRESFANMVAYTYNKINRQNDLIRQGGVRTRDFGWRELRSHYGMAMWWPENVDDTDEAIEEAQRQKDTDGGGDAQVAVVNTETAASAEEKPEEPFVLTPEEHPEAAKARVKRERARKRVKARLLGLNPDDIPSDDKDGNNNPDAGKAASVDEWGQTSLWESGLRDAGGMTMDDVMNLQWALGTGVQRPKKKKGESDFAYIARVAAWEAQQEKLASAPPAPDHDEIDGRWMEQYESDHKAWMQRHGLDDDGMEKEPQRSDYETVDDYAEALKAWEKQQQARNDREDPEPMQFEYMQKAQDEYRNAYQKWQKDNDILEEGEGMLNFSTLFDGRGVVETPTKEGENYQNPEYPSKEADVTGVNRPMTEADERAAMAESRMVMAETGARLGFDNTPQGARRTVKYGIIDRRKNLELNGAEDAIFLDKLKDRIKEAAVKMQMKAEDLDKALPFVIESPTRLAEVIGEIYAEAMGHPLDFYWLKKNLNDILSKEAVEDQTIEHVRTIVTQLSESGNATLNKAIEDYRLHESEELRPILDDVTRWYDELYAELEAAGLRHDAGHVTDYVNHVWDPGKSDAKAYETYVRMTSPNMRMRQLSTYAKGIELGLAPRYDTLTKMMAHYSRQNNEAMANKGLMDYLTGLTVDLLNSDGEVVNILSVLSSEEPNSFIKDKYVRYEVPSVGGVWVLKDVQKRFATIFGQEQNRDSNSGELGTWNAYDMAGDLMKKLQLSVSGFHALALTEVSLVQKNPLLAFADLMKYTFWDSMRSGKTPPLAHPDDFKDAAAHLVKLGASDDYAAAQVRTMTGKLRKMAQEVYDKQKAAGAVPLLTTTLLDWFNKGSDKLLWDYIHDGLKVAAFRGYAKKLREEAKKKGWTDAELDKMLDEAGQYVNDAFGGQYWEVIGITPSTLRTMRRLLLSPDWFVSTSRHAFSMTGFGSLYAPEGFRDYLTMRKKWQKNDGAETPTDEDPIHTMYMDGKEEIGNEGRKFRAKGAWLCYSFLVPIFYGGLMNVLNMALRKQDEERELAAAEEKRKTDPEYRSPYELVYPDGMKWYDYTMYGNSEGNNTQLFVGRYNDGTERYIRWGKQFREIPEFFMGRYGVEVPGPLLERMMGKSNPVLGTILDILRYYGAGLLNKTPDQKDLEKKYGKHIGALAMVAKKFLPFSVPTQEDKEFYWTDLLLPSKKGFSNWRALDAYQHFILAGDMDGIAAVTNACIMNGIDAEKQLEAAIKIIEAQQKKERVGGVQDLATAMTAFDESKSLKERESLKKKMQQFMLQQKYKQFVAKDAVERVENALNGTDEQSQGISKKQSEKYMMLLTSEDMRDDIIISKAKKAVDEVVRTGKAEAAGGDGGAYLRKHQKEVQIKAKIGAYQSAINKLKKTLGKGNDEAVMTEIRELRKKAVDEVGK